MWLRGFFALCLLLLGAGPVWAACSSPQTAIVASGGTAVFGCNDFGFDIFPPIVPPSHGSLSEGTPTNVFALIYTNNGDGALSDTFQLRDFDTDATVTFNITVLPATSPLTVSPASLPVPNVGVAYSQTLSTTGGVGPYSYVLNGGTLPPGLTLSSSGTISGTPTASGSHTFTVAVTDSTAGTPLTTNKSYTFVIPAPALDITPDAPPNAVQTAPYSLTFVGSGGTAPYTFSIESGSLPAGLSMNSAGVVSGTPTTLGSATFTLKMDDNTTISTGGEHFIAQSVTITVVAGPTIIISPATLPGATAGVAYSQTTTASGGTAPYTFIVSAGALPAGLTLNNNTGVLGGTPTATGTFNFTVRATDANTFTGTRAYTLTVAAPTIAVAPTTLPSATAGTSYSQTVTASGGTSPYTFAITAGALPAGLTLSSAGVLSGTPTAGGSFNFTVTATDATLGLGAPFTGSRAYTLTVNAATVAVAPVSLPNGTAGVAYSQGITASGGTAPYAFAVTAGSLPTGLTLSNAGVLSGTPTANGTFNFTITATDSSTGAGPYTGSRAYSLSLAEQAPVANPVSATVAYGSNANPITLNITGGTPLTVAVSTAPAHGTVSVAGTSVSYTPDAGYAGPDSFTYTAGNGAGTSAPATVTITVSAPTITVTASGPLTAQLGVAYTQTFTWTGGTAPYSAISVLALPNGLTITGTTADSVTIAGTPTQTGVFNLAASATDSSTGTGPFTTSQNFALTVSAPTLTITPAPGTLLAPYGVAYTQTFSASGGTAPYSFTLVAGTLPVGMSLSSAGVLSGTPTVPGNYALTIRATDSSTGAGAPFSITGNYLIQVDAPTIAFNPTTLPDGVGGTAYNATLNAQGGVGPYTYSLLSGALPVGVSFSSAGVFSGVPLSSGTFNLTIRATDSHGQNGQQVFTFAIAAPTIAITPATLANGVRGTAYNAALSANGGTSPYTFAVTAGAVPTGLSLSSAGALAGTPTAAGSFNFTVTATDALSFSGTASYTVVVAEAVPVAVADAAATLSPQPVTVAVTANDTGVITSIAVVAAPGHGTALVSGLNVVYTPAAGFSGTDTFTYNATGPGGTSAPATVTITVNPLPVAVSSTASVAAGLPVVVDLTQGASGGPFTAATLVALTPSSSGTATIAHVGSSYQLTYTPVTSFSGVATVQFTLSNAFATSVPATVTFNVAPRPDPSQDPEVLGMLDAQAESARRFASAQIGNFQQRMEDLHGNRGAAGFDNGLTFQTSSRCLDVMGRKPGDTCNLVASNDGGGAGTPPVSADSGQRSGTAAFGTWIGGMIRSGNQDGRGGGSGADFESDGVSAGVDYRITPAFALGGGLGYGRDDSDVGDNGSRVEGNASTLALYASYHPGDTYFLDGLLGYQRLSYDLRRFVTSNGGFVQGSRDGTQRFASISTGAEIRRDAWQFTPYARLDLARATLDGYAEYGDPIYSLVYGDQDVDTTTGNLGMRFEFRRATAWGAFAPQLRLEYQHDFKADSSATMQYADLLTGPLYRADLDGFDRNRFMLGLGAMFYLPHGLSLRVEYRGLFGNSGDDDNGVMFNFGKGH
jgi:outer membrane autotransporter protein